MKKIILLLIIVSNPIITMDDSSNYYQLYLQMNSLHDEDSIDFTESRLHKHYLKTQQQYSQPQATSIATDDKNKDLWKKWVEEYMDKMPFLAYCDSVEKNDTQKNYTSQQMSQRPSHALFLHAASRQKMYRVKQILRRP